MISHQMFRFKGKHNYFVGLKSAVKRVAKRSWAWIVDKAPYAGAVFGITLSAAGWIINAIADKHAEGNAFALGINIGVFALVWFGRWRDRQEKWHREMQADLDKMASSFKELEIEHRLRKELTKEYDKKYGV